MTVPQAPRRVLEARAGVRRLLEREPGFVGTGVTLLEDKFSVVVLVEVAECEAARRAPVEYEGVPVRVQVSGTAKID